MGFQDDRYDEWLATLSAADTMWLTTAEPANYAGIAAVAVTSVSLGPGDFTISNGAVNGRRLRVAAQPGLEATTDGDPSWVCLTDGTTLLWTTQCFSLAVTAGELIDVPEFTVAEIRDRTFV